MPPSENNSKIEALAAMDIAVKNYSSLRILKNFIFNKALQ
jgi:hypothetical protein